MFLSVQPQLSKQCHVLACVQWTKKVKKELMQQLPLRQDRRNPAMAFLCSCALLFNLVAINTCHLANQSKHPVAFCIFCEARKSRLHIIRDNWGDRSQKWGMKCAHMVHMALFLFQLFIGTHRNIQAEQQITICFSSQSSLSLSLSTGCFLLSGRKEVMGGGWISSQGSPLIYTIWVGRQHSSCASSSQSDNLPYRMSVNAKSSNPFKAGWQELTSLWPLRANHASRLCFSHRLTYLLACISVPRMLVNLLHSPRDSVLNCLSKLPQNVQPTCRQEKRTLT